MLTDAAHSTVFEGKRAIEYFSKPAVRNRIELYSGPSDVKKLVKIVSSHPLARISQSRDRYGSSKEVWFNIDLKLMQALRGQCADGKYRYTFSENTVVLDGLQYPITLHPEVEGVEIEAKAYFQNVMLEFTGEENEKVLSKGIQSWSTQKCCVHTEDKCLEQSITLSQRHIPFFHSFMVDSSVIKSAKLLVDGYERQHWTADIIEELCQSCIFDGSTLKHLSISELDIDPETMELPACLSLIRPYTCLGKNSFYRGAHVELKLVLKRSVDNFFLHFVSPINIGASFIKRYGILDFEPVLQYSAKSEAPDTTLKEIVVLNDQSPQTASEGSAETETDKSSETNKSTNSAETVEESATDWAINLALNVVNEAEIKDPFRKSRRAAELEQIENDIANKIS